MRLKVYTLSGTSNARVARPFYLDTPETLVLEAAASVDDGYIIAVSVGNDTVAYRLAWGYASLEDARTALDEFMTEQGFEQIKREESE